jgi:ectoine hydroxylase-related dioxygenase (phytanoyl-CoA dioxygenase family)
MYLQERSTFIDLVGLAISDMYFQATAVIPGSHLWGTDRAPKVDEVTYAEMEPGSALFTLGCECDPAEN